MRSDCISESLHAMSGKHTNQSIVVSVFHRYTGFQQCKITYLIQFVDLDGQSKMQLKERLPIADVPQEESGKPFD